jgi:plasmid stabilization system protein ParE
MAEFLLRPKAVADLDSIWDYTVDTWSEEQAERYIRMLHSGFESIAREPARGRPCERSETATANTGWAITSFSIRLLRLVVSMW